MSQLTTKQERFCQEYVVDFNATQAAIRAGYSQPTASQTASRLLTNVKVQSVLAEVQAEDAAKTQLTREFVIEGLMGIAETAEVPSARVRAYELLGKHLALFTDRLEVTQIPDPALVRSWIEALESDLNST